MAEVEAIAFKIEKHLGVLSESPTGWTKEANLVSWNGAPAKLDIREWSPDHERMTKGITLFKEEAKALKDVLQGRDLDRDFGETRTRKEPDLER